MGRVPHLTAGKAEELTNARDDHSRTSWMGHSRKRNLTAILRSESSTLKLDLEPHV